MAGFGTYAYLTGQKPRLNVLLEGDSWINSPVSPDGNKNFANHLACHGLNITNNAVSASELITDVVPRLVSHLDDNDRDDYDIICFNGSANDLAVNAASITLQELKDALVEGLTRALQETQNVIYIGTVPLGGAAYWDTPAGSYPIETMAGDFDTFAKAYCRAIGVKFFHTRNVMAAGGFELGAQWDDPPIPNHPGVTGAKYMASQIRPLFNTAAPTRRTSHSVVRARPNPELLTAVDCDNIRAMIDSLESEWGSAHEVWLLNQTDVTASGNAMTGLKAGTVLLPRSGAAGTTVETVTADTASGLRGIVLAAGKYLRQAFTQTTLGRDVAIGMVRQAQSSYASNQMCFGSSQSFSADQLIFQTLADTDMRGYGYSDSPAVTISNNPSTLAGKCVELRTRTLDATNQTVTIYASGVAADEGTTNGISRTYQGTLGTVEVVFNGQVIGTVFAGMAVNTTLGAIYITDGTTNALRWSAAIEAATDN